MRTAENRFKNLGQIIRGEHKELGELSKYVCEEDSKRFLLSKLVSRFNINEPVKLVSVN